MSDLHLVTDGLLFPEGPVAMRDGSVLVVEIAGQRLTRVAPDGTKTLVAAIPGGPNGAAIGPDGAVYVCNNGGMRFVDLPGGGIAPIGVAEDYRGGSIDRVDLATGEVTTLYGDGGPDGSGGRRTLNSPNDLVFDAHGGFWFTDLGRRLPESHDAGAIYYARADGSAIDRVRVGMHGPNGIGLSPDGDELFVAETITGRLWVFPVVAPGILAPSDNLWVPGEVRGPLPGYQALDSLAVDAAGDPACATLINGGITTFRRDGTTEFLRVPDFATTNICFGGDDMCTAWITASSTGKLYRTRWPQPGLPLTHYT